MGLIHVDAGARFLSVKKLAIAIKDMIICQRRLRLRKTSSSLSENALPCDAPGVSWTKQGEKSAFDRVRKNV